MANAHLLLLTYFTLFFSHASSDFLDTVKQRLNKFKEAYNNSQSDIIFILDVSYSVPVNGFKDEKLFVTSLLNEISVAYYSTRVAVITFGDTVKTNINYINTKRLTTEDTTKCEFNNLFKYRVNHRREGATDMNLAFRHGNQLLEQARLDGFGREDINTVAVLITDGYWNGRNPKSEIDKMKNGRRNVDVLSVGVGWADPRYLGTLASSPERVVYAKTFDRFRDLARYIRGDAHEREYMRVSIGKCSNSCHKDAFCSCGTVGGKYACSCNAGFSGNGHNCVPCPRGTYKKYGSPEKCHGCPKNSNTDTLGNIDISACRCNKGFTGDPARKVDCNPVKCGPMIAPENGDMTGDNCTNVYGGKCFFSCKKGYERQGPPYRECQADKKWSGSLVTCNVVKCTDLPQITNGDRACSGSNYGDTCTFSCEKGYKLIGSQQKRCQEDGHWTGTDIVRCEAKKCPALNKVPFSKLSPKDCSTRPQPYKALCVFTCLNGYSKQGNGNLKCQDDGSWDTDVPSCKDTERPQIFCPRAMQLETDEGKPFATVKLNPEYDDNSRLFGNVDIELKIYIGKEEATSPYAFAIGTHVVTYKAKDQAGNENQCSFSIAVKDKEKPQVIACPKDEVRKIKEKKVTLYWGDVKFTDNAGDENLLIFHSHDNNTEIQTNGGPNVITYTAMDKAKNTAECIFRIFYLIEWCKPYPAPVNGGLLQKPLGSFGNYFIPSCNKGFEFASKPDARYFCSAKRKMWQNRNMPWPDCTVEYNPNAQKGFEYQYLTGNCNNPDVQKEAKKSFLQQFELFVKSFYPTFCSVEKTCTVDHVHIECGVSTLSGKRNQRGIPGKTLFINFKLNLKDVENAKKLQQDLGGMIDKAKGHTALKKLSTTQGNFDLEDAHSTVTKLICKNGTVLGLNTDHKDKCQSCPPGTKYDLKLEACTDCPANEYQSETGRFHCIPCPAGTITVKPTKNNECLARCPRGTFSETGAENCTICDIGFYQNVEGSTVCLKCPGTTTTAERGSKSVSQCRELCLPGTYSPTGLEPCSSCPIGQYQELPNSRGCVHCPNNKTTVVDGAKSSSMCIELNPCSLSPCENEATCSHVLAESGDYKCKCKPGYGGKNCENEIDECESNPCYTGATCLDKVNSFICICAPGFHGQLCDKISKSHCNSKPCVHGACIEQPDNFLCNCDAGYTGTFCESEINSCKPSPCGANGKCVNRRPGYTCECDAGFEGVHCQLTKDVCLSSPCENGGTCKSITKDFKCECPAGYLGKRCEIDVNECASSPCKNNGECIDEVNGYRCRCQRNYGGVNCEIARTVDYDLRFADSKGVGFSSVNLEKDISAFTIAFWMKTTDSDNTEPGTPLSYAVEFEGKVYDNALTITDYTAFKININNKVFKTNVDGDDGKWHHIAVTWESSSGQVTLYKDGSNVASGTLEHNKLIPGGGVMILGQEQDKVGGDFSLSESFDGDISQVNMWDHVISATEIEKLAGYCVFEKYGNLVAWGDFSNNKEGHIEEITPSQGCKENRCWSKWINRNRPSDGDESESRHGVCSNPTSFDCQTVSGASFAGLNLPKGAQCNINGVSCKKEVFKEKDYTQTKECPDFKVRYACPCSVKSSCSSTTCKNGGNCVNRLDGYQCVCPDGFTGDHCEKELDCPDPRPFANGGVTGNSFKAGNQVTFYCNDGFRLAGSASVTCRRGKWQGQLPTCGVCSSCVCGKGYRRVQGVCQDINECSKDNGHCQGQCINRPGSYKCVCEKNTELAADGLKCKDKNECLPNDGRGPCAHFCTNTYKGYECSCKKGFTAIGNNCATQACPKLSTPVNGRKLSTIPITSTDGVETFECNAGFKLDGAASRTCLKDGTWSGRQPKCTRIRCYVPAAIENGRLSSQAYYGGSKVSYSCNEGYKLNGPSTLTCLDNSKWDSSPPTCLRSDCPKLVAPQNVRLLSSQTSVGSTMTYECSEGYTFNENAKLYTQCLASKQWSVTTLPSCQVVNCGDPGTVSHGTRNGNVFTYKAVVSYSCNPGYKVTGSTTRTCQLNGEWSGEKTECSAKSCGDPGTPSNGKKHGSVYLYGNAVSFECNKNYVLIGVSSITCQPSGSWSAVKPQCKLIDCGDPGTPSNGERVGDETYVGSKMYYECKPGYRLNGANLLTCQQNGKWSEVIPSCSVSSCGGYLNGPSGQILSPDYPNVYESNSYCVWKISVPANKKVLIRFKRLDTENGKDWVLIADAKKNIQIAQLTGVNANELRYTTSSNEMFVKFFSDGQRESTGFEATYETVSCGGVITDLNAVIQSPSYPNNYENNLVCVWEVVIPGHSITLQFDDFMTENEYDFLDVHNRVSQLNDKTRIAYFSGPLGMARKLSSPFGYMHLVLTTNNYRSDKGFKARVMG